MTPEEGILDTRIRKEATSSVTASHVRYEVLGMSFLMAFLMYMERGAIGRDDAGRFLAAMLQSIEAQVGELGGFEMAEDAGDTAMIMEPIVFEMAHICFYACSPRIACSIAPLQISWSEAEGPRTAVTPL